MRFISKWITDLNVKHKSKKFEEKIGQNLGQDKVFLDLTSKVLSIKGNINKVNLIKIKSFYSEKYHVKRIKRQSIDCEKFFTNHISNKGLICRIYEISQNLAKWKNNPNRKLAKHMKRHFTEKYIHMAIKHMKRCSTSLAIKQVQIKTTVRYHYTPIRMIKIRK